MGSSSARPSLQWRLQLSQASSPAQWHYTDASLQQKGPFSREQMLAMARDGTVGPATLVWSAGMPGWVPFAQSPLASQVPSGAAARGGGPQPGPSTSPDTFQGAVRACFERYATFGGRARRPEYWYFVLFIVVVGIATSIVDSMLFGGMMYASPINALFNLVVLVPSLAVGARRLHDTDRSGWWLLLWLVPILGWIVLIVFYCQRGSAGPNRFG